MALPEINIGSKLDAKGFKQAETATEKLGKQAKRLAVSLGLAFGTAQVIAYGKNAVKAFADNEKSAKRLEIALKNLGLAFDNQAIEKNLDNISAKFGYEGEILREAFQKLVTATGSTTKSQELLTLSLDVAAGSGEDLLTVNQDLASVYVGNTKSLRKYNLGLSQSELKTLDVNAAVALLTKTFQGSGTAELETFSGQMRVLTESANNAQEIIGGGLIESFKLLAGDEGIVKATDKMETFAQKISDALVGATDLFLQLNKLGSIKTPADSKFELVPSLLDELAGRGKKVLGTDKVYGGIYATKFLGEVEATNAAARAKADAEAAKRLKQRLADQKKALDNEKKTIAAKKLANAIDKAKLLLGKNEGVFDIEAIQNNAALINQAEQLGKTTSAAQMLQIANDTARLNIKRSMYELEQAIASGDIAAIENATKKLNEDLKIYNALSGQKTQMMAIETILKNLNPKDLINIQNLRDALDLLEKINIASTGSKSAPKTVSKPAPSVAGLIPATTIAETNANVAALGGVITQIQPNLKEFTPSTGLLSGRNPNGSEYNYSVTINAGMGSDPNAIAEAIDQVITDAVQRGTLRGGLLAI